VVGAPFVLLGVGAFVFWGGCPFCLHGLVLFSEV
jgi:hypothetical protein